MKIDWWRLTCSRDPTTIEWDMASGTIRAKTLTKPTWRYGRATKVKYALECGHGLIGGKNENDTSLPVSRMQGDDKS